MTEDHGARQAAPASIFCPPDFGLCHPCSQASRQGQSDVGPRPERGLRRRGLTSVVCHLSSAAPAGPSRAPGSTWWSQRGGPTRPIPNSAVKLRCAQGTAPRRGGRAGRRQVEPAAQGQMAEDRDRRPALEPGDLMSDDRGPRSVVRASVRAAGYLAACRTRPDLDLARHDSLPDPWAQTVPSWSVLCSLTSDI